MECRRPTSRDLNAALSAMQFQISPLKMEAAGVNRSANSAEYTRWNGYLWRKAAGHRNGGRVNAVDGIRTTAIFSIRRAAERPSVR
jgi:hypothetical protein